MYENALKAGMDLKVKRSNAAMGTNNAATATFKCVGKHFQSQDRLKIDA